MQSQLYMVSMFFALELLVICSLHCLGYFSDSDGSNRMPAYPNIMDYEWTSEVNDITQDVVSAREQYIRDTQECFHHFYEAIAQPKSYYWSSSKLDQWPEIMAEQPWIARDGWLYRGCRDTLKNHGIKEDIDIDPIKDIHGFKENILARAVMKYADGSEYVVGQTVHLHMHRQSPRMDPRFDEQRKTIEWTILAIFVHEGKNKIDKQKGPIFLVYSELGTHFKKQEESVGGKLTRLDGVPDEYGFDWPKPRWKFITESKITKVATHKVQKFYPKILSLALQGWPTDPKMPEQEVVAIPPPKSTTSTVDESKEDESKPAAKKRKITLPKKPKKDDKLAKELAQRSETVVALSKKLEEAEAELKTTIQEKKNWHKKAEELEKAGQARLTTKMQLDQLKNDLLVFYATKYDSLEPKDKGKTSLEATIPIAIRKHFSKDEIRGYTG